MHTVTKSIIQLVIVMCLAAGTTGSVFDVHAQLLEGRDSEQSQKIRGQSDDFWIELPERSMPSKSLASRYKFLGYALYGPELIRNDICVTRMVRTGYASDDDIEPEIVESNAISHSGYFVAFREPGSKRDCRELDFESEYFQVTQPVDTDTLLELRRLLGSIANDDTAKAVSEGRSLDSLQISRISVSYTREFGDLTYKLSARNAEGLVLSVTIGATEGTLRVIEILGLAE
jgi:hypothetical protein